MKTAHPSAVLDPRTRLEGMAYSGARTANGQAPLQTVSRALDILEALVGDSLGLVELARRTGLQPSTTHRMLATLEHRDYVVRDPQSGRYSLSGRAHDLRGEESIETDVRTLARPFMKRIQRVSKHIVNLSTLAGDEVVFVDRLISRRLHTALIKRPARVPAHASASGKTLLAFSRSPRERLRNMRFAACTPETIVTADGLVDELESVRNVGFAVDREEYRTGIACVAAPILNRAGRAVATIGVSDVTKLLTQDLYDDLGELVRETAIEASRLLGYEPDSVEPDASGVDDLELTHLA